MFWKRTSHSEQLISFLPSRHYQVTCSRHLTLIPITFCYHPPSTESLILLQRIYSPFNEPGCLFSIILKKGCKKKRKSISSPLRFQEDYSTASVFLVTLTEAGKAEDGAEHDHVTALRETNVSFSCLARVYKYLC